MVDPKTFYRELDGMLSTIGKGRSDKNFFVTILNELEQKFGDTLHIRDSHIFEQRGDDFVFLNTSTRRQDSKIARKIPVGAEVIQHVLKHGLVVYDTPGLFQDFDLKLDTEKMTPAVILVHNPVRKWLLVFELEKGSAREEILLFLNAMRTALNYRLFSEMMKSDLRKAEQIQKSLLPKMAPKIAGYEIYGYSQAAEVVGGDFYDYFQFEEQDFGCCIGDASGHGIPAALLVRDVVIGLRMGLAQEMRLIHTLKKLNKVIQQSTYSTNFVSLFIGEIESDGHLFYVNAGHPPPFVVSGNRITDLEATGITLGFMPDIELRRSYIHMKPGSVLMLYSDGIVERQESEDEQFMVHRLKELVAENRHKSAEEIVKQVFDVVFNFGKRKSWEDDATLVVIKRTSGG
ncbi:MAG: PP2C family protein-serine/threonine phosphatase [bacterium]